MFGHFKATDYIPIDPLIRLIIYFLVVTLVVIVAFWRVSNKSKQFFLVIGIILVLIFWFWSEFLK